MLAESLVVGFVLPFEAQSVANEINALSSCGYVDVVVVITQKADITREAQAHEAVTFPYEPVNTLDVPAVAALNAFFAANETFISAGADPLLVIVEGNQPELSSDQITSALDELARTPDADSLSWHIAGSQLTAITYEAFMHTGQKTTENGLVFFTRPV